MSKPFLQPQLGIWLSVVLIGTIGLLPADAADPGPSAEAIVAQLESLRGICVILGDRDVALATKLARVSELLIYVQMPDGRDVEAARRSLSSGGLLNKRVYLERGENSHVHLASNLADLAIVLDSGQDRVSRGEVMRVLRPGGKALLGSQTVVKPALDGIDDWSHPYHGPDNNPQSGDQVARAPYLTQFLAEPWYCPMPEVTVVSGGRVFKAFGSRAFRRPQWPMLNTLIALNGYNGMLLWKRELDPDFMIHRNTMIATPDTLFLADADSCKLIDARTGELKDEIKAPKELSDGGVWKWMALENGTLYALVGEKEPPGDALKGTPFRGAGWPWWQISDYGWGFGRIILAIDPSTKKVLWSHRETEPLDTRAMCMRKGRIYFHSLEEFLGCLDAKTGQIIWRTTGPQVIEAIGERRPAQRAVWGFASTAYAKCTDDAIYFAGPQQTKLVAVSTRDGSLLWNYPDDGNFQLVAREDALYAMGSNHPSQKFDLLTGKSLLRLPNRSACTRATGSVDGIFVRGGGTRCWDVEAEKWLHISPMRPACHDGVVIAGGQLYWGPWMCGCNLSLLGVICLGPAGDFDFSAKATETERLKLAEDSAKVAPLSETADDWPTFRKDNLRSTRSGRPIPAETRMLWESPSDSQNTPTSPVAVADWVFAAGSDGTVKALDAANGAPRWKFHTGGSVVYPPTIAEGRIFVGAADGWVYALEATSGRLLWRFRAAPVERKISVYGALKSTWPVGSGVLVEGGVAYAAAGIANYDGIHVYALDTANGRIRWQNNTSGVVAAGPGDGACVQGHLLLNDDKLYLAGGNRVKLASYNIANGQFQPARAAKFGTDRRGPRGKDLFLRHDGSIAVSGTFPLYSRPDDVHFIAHGELTCELGTITVITNGLGLLPPGTTLQDKPKPIWASRPFNDTVAVAIADNAVVVAGTNRQFATPQTDPVETHGITALDIKTGQPLWKHALPAGPVSWGVAIDRHGRVLTSLRDGRVVCFGTAKQP